MLALLASPLFRYGTAIAGVFAALGGLYGLGRHQGALSERAAWQAIVAEQKTQAAKMIADRVAENTLKEAESASLNAKLAQEVTDAHAETASALDRYNRAIADRMRTQASRSCSTPPGPAQAGSPPGGKILESPGLIVSGQALKDIGTLAAEADELITAMKACQAWSLAHGR